MQQNFILNLVIVSCDDKRNKEERASQSDVTEYTMEFTPTSKTPAMCSY